MARAIDKRIMLDLIIDAKKTDPETGPFLEWLAEYLVDHLPTLTPPNEPLTFDELAAMKRQPVFVVEINSARQYWAIVGMLINNTGIELITFDDPEDFGARELYGHTWVCYRCPPEGGNT